MRQFRHVTPAAWRAEARLTRAMASQLGARKSSGFKAVSTAPSINKTPVGSS